MSSIAKTVTKAVGSIVGIKKPNVGSGGRGSGKTFTADEVRRDLANLVSARQEASKPKTYQSGPFKGLLPFGTQNYSNMPGGAGAIVSQQQNNPYRKVSQGPFEQMRDQAGTAFLRKYGFQPDIMRQALEQFDAQQAKQQKAGGGQQGGTGGGEVVNTGTGGGGGTDSAAPGGEPAPERIVGDVGSLGVSSGSKRGGRRGRVKTLLSGLGGNAETFGG